MNIISTTLLTKSFGGNTAVNQVSIDIKEKQCTGIIGTNGSGKTTLLNLISGMLKADSGDVVYAGRTITNMPSHDRAMLGIARSFQHINLFPNLTSLENVRLAVQAKRQKGFQIFSSHLKDKVCMERAMLHLEKVGLAGKAALSSAVLTHGDKRKLELAMILSQDPNVLLLDEPTAGMSVEEVPSILEILMGIKKEGDKTIVLVEHKMDFLLTIVDEVAVLLNGNMVAMDKPNVIMADEKVRTAYLGE
ncbi:MAG: ABC transporter ATP-binding protein [Deltaproteobacteria bacterium]|nr:ABC transporter ATP-binding protein [Deltaproteobacteria bacterium]